MPQEMIRVGLVGVTGYTGMELARLLTGHQNMKLTAATSRTEAGKRLGDLYPFLNGLPGADVILIEPEPELIAKECDLAFLAVPHTAATEMAAALVERGLKVVDLSADFRLKNAETYEQWYKVEHKRPDLLPEAVYGLPELYASDIAKARLVANPGCYPTSIILGMTAALADGLIETHGIVADSKSGVSGAGRSAKLGSLYCEVADSFKAYGIGTHRHTPEIEQELSRLAHGPMTISFNPHLVPMNRGILSTIYAQLKALSQADAQRCMRNMGGQPVGARPPPASFPRPVMSVGRFCDMSVIVDPRPTVSSWYPSSTTSAAAHPGRPSPTPTSCAGFRSRPAHALRHDAVRPPAARGAALNPRAPPSPPGNDSPTPQSDRKRTVPNRLAPVWNRSFLACYTALSQQAIVFNATKSIIPKNWL
ncbi:MAG: N-acetyl-gamma-glutamyl-phosphate reductase [Bilophila wadsworthia]